MFISVMRNFFNQRKLESNKKKKIIFPFLFSIDWRKFHVNWAVFTLYFSHNRNAINNKNFERNKAHFWAFIDIRWIRWSSLAVGRFKRMKTRHFIFILWVARRFPNAEIFTQQSWKWRKKKKWKSINFNVAFLFYAIKCTPTFVNDKHSFN